MTPSPCRWEAFPTPGALTHTRIIWAFSPPVPQVPGVTPGSPLCPWCFGHPLWRNARHRLSTPSRSCTLIKFVMKSIDTLCHGLGGIGKDCKRLVSFGSRFGSQSGLSPPCMANSTTDMMVYSSSWPAFELSWFFFKTNSLNLPCDTYTQFCSYLSNSSTNLTS